MGSRLQRGRSYARKGQVIIVSDVGPGLVDRTSAGQPGTPLQGAHRYRCLRQERMGAGGGCAGRKCLVRSRFARLVRCRDDIEEVFAGLGLPLFPATARDLSLDCSCPDVAVPCKHIAATFYLLAESFDDDPFAILAWRGREREDLLANLAGRPVGRSPER